MLWLRFLSPFLRRFQNVVRPVTAYILTFTRSRIRHLWLHPTSLFPDRNSSQTQRRFILWSFFVHILCVIQEIFEYQIAFCLQYYNYRVVSAQRIRVDLRVYSFPISRASPIALPSQSIDSVERIPTTVQFARVQSISDDFFFFIG